MTYTCEVIERSAQPVLSMRIRTPVHELPEQLGRVYGAIAQYLAELSEQPVGAPFTAYYNMDTQDLDVEIGFPVAKKLPGKEEIQAGQIPGGEFATCLHTGPYSEVGLAYNVLSTWMQAHGHEPTGIAYELYLNDPGETPPEKLQTQILFPLK